MNEESVDMISTRIHQLNDDDSDDEFDDDVSRRTPKWINVSTYVRTREFTASEYRGRLLIMDRVCRPSDRKTRAKSG